MNNPRIDQRTSGDYLLLPFRFARLPGLPGEVLLTSETGEYLFLDEEDFERLVNRRSLSSDSVHENLLGRHFIWERGTQPPIERMAVQVRTRKGFLREGPALHAFVVTLRCDHSCLYCQVSRQAVGRGAFDMNSETARAAVDRMFESTASALSVEFQGGEPLLAFDRIREVIDRVLERNEIERRQISFVVASTLHLLTDQMLEFFRSRHVHLSTSLDGPEWLHNANRPQRNNDSFGLTIRAIARAREALGDDAVAALTTLTRESLRHPEEIIDTYVEHGFRSVFLRPMSPYGFAAKLQDRLGYGAEDYLRFYDKALDYLLRLNKGGTVIDEAYATLLLTQILTPFPTPYVDLRSPTGGGLGAVVYNYDGWVYPSDEARMLAEMGDTRLRLGQVTTKYADLLRSQSMQWLLGAGVAESIPGCSDCAFLAYCGADPVDALARDGDVVGHRPSSFFCRKHRGLFRILFGHLRLRDPDTLRVFLGWMSHRNPRAIVHPGYAA